MFAIVVCFMCNNADFIGESQSRTHARTHACTHVHHQQSGAHRHPQMQQVDVSALSTTPHASSHVPTQVHSGLVSQKRTHAALRLFVVTTTHSCRSQAVCCHKNALMPLSGGSCRVLRVRTCDQQQVCSRPQLLLKVHLERCCTPVSCCCCVNILRRHHSCCWCCW
jgi:hypothetical protein